MLITSAQNSKIKQIKRLRDKRGREKAGRFVIDDARDLRRAVGYRIEYALYCPDIATPDDQTLLETLAQTTTIYEVSHDLMQKASYRQNPGPWLAVMITPPAKTDITTITDDLLLALVNLQKPGNIGALLRTADATGFRTVLLVDTALDLYNPNIIRSSTGACFLDNIYTTTTADVQAFVRDRGYSVVAAVVDGDQDLFETDFRGKTAVVLGTEDTGLSHDWIKTADQRVRIPMVGRISDSLNVSVSGAVFMYEALRQRFCS